VSRASFAVMAARRLSFLASVVAALAYSCSYPSILAFRALISSSRVAMSDTRRDDWSEESEMSG
jgi:hypothetical protein